ncbi:hypothetical protein E3P99_02434 [Wallemia hederae]|uniref:Uncharacterized protein n=1 Tax=Wallemia hederae TaxID=1540922 RepID=A0A4T0FJP1_9BASI|nr:hypothetical protein E3P99_02434 [Wallemia hederae]
MEIKRVIEENKQLRNEIEALKNNYANYPNANELKNLAVLVRDTLHEFDNRERMMRRRILVLQHQKDQLAYQLDSTSSNGSQTAQTKVVEEKSDSDIEVLRNLVKSTTIQQNVDPLWFKRVRHELEQVTTPEEERALIERSDRRNSSQQSNHLQMQFEPHDGDQLSDTVLDDYVVQSASPPSSHGGIPQRPPARQSMREFEDDTQTQTQFNLPNDTTSRPADIEVAYKHLTEAFEKLADENIRNSVAVHQIIKTYRQHTS